MTLRLLVSCGEASGDLYAGALVRELQTLVPDLAVEGIGGPQLAGAGGRLIEDYRGLAVTGLLEAVPKVPRFLRTLSRLVAAAKTSRPDLLVAIDSPDLNLRLARRIKKIGVPVVYYVSPQIWAWRPGRLKAIRAIADRMLVIFPFEEAIYREGGVPVSFVGHPLVDLVDRSQPRERFLRSLGLDPTAPTIAVLPGSRPNEVRRMLPDLLRAAAIVRRRVNGAQVLVARAPSLDDELFEASREAGAFQVVERQTDAVLAAADVALVASGTATVQSALHGTPMVVVYRVSPVTYWIGRRLVQVDMIAMVNLIAGRRIVPELIQEAFTPDAVASEAVDLLTNPTRAADMRAGLADVRHRLGGPGASLRAATEILKVVGAAGAR